MGGRVLLSASARQARHYGGGVERPCLIRGEHDLERAKVFLLLLQTGRGRQRQDPRVGCDCGARTHRWNYVLIGTSVTPATALSILSPRG